MFVSSYPWVALGRSESVHNLVVSYKQEVVYTIFKFNLTQRSGFFLSPISAGPIPVFAMVNFSPTHHCLATVCGSAIVSKESQP
jgi:hypothetical protein